MNLYLTGINDTAGIISLNFAKNCICHYLGAAESAVDIVFSKGVCGKPFAAALRLHGVESTEIPHFSLSHSGGLYICAVADFNIGADCQKRLRYGRARMEKIAGRFYTPAERARLSESGSYDENFFDIWAKKEAYVKYTGKGLSQGLNSFSVIEGTVGFCGAKFITPSISPLYSTAICFEGGENKCKITKLNMNFQEVKNV